VETKSFYRFYLTPISAAGFHGNFQNRRLLFDWNLRVSPPLHASSFTFCSFDQEGSI
jgi:hypothetical protein